MFPHSYLPSVLNPAEVSRKLVINLRDADSIPAGVVRAYISCLYQDVYDATIAAQRPHLDIRVLLPPTATTAGAAAAAGIGAAAAVVGGSSPASAATTTTTTSNNNNMSPLSNNAVVSNPTHAILGGAAAVGAGDGVVDTTSAFSSIFPAVAGSSGGAGWTTREAAELEPELEVLFSDEPQGGREGILNADRARAGFRPVDVVSLESVAKGAYKPDYFYAENVLAEIPTFAQVRRRFVTFFFFCTSLITVLLYSPESFWWRGRF